MKTEIFYSVQGGGDGSAYPEFFESEELAEIDQEFLSEGWGESCTGSLTIEHDSPINIIPVTTLQECYADTKYAVETYGHDPAKLKKLEALMDPLHMDLMQAKEAADAE